ncbi:hypothetical protein Tco_0485263 [Tanacetum coccineum]
MKIVEEGKIEIRALPVQDLIRFDADAKARLLSECEKLYSKEDLQRISRKISTWSRKGSLHKQLGELLISHGCSVTQTVFNEAIEEGNSGTYVVEVLWNRFNGTTSLCKFSLTNHKPFSKIKTLALTNFDTQWLQIILENGIPLLAIRLTVDSFSCRGSVKWVQNERFPFQT